jgi:hypothetical protein
VLLGQATGAADGGLRHVLSHRLGATAATAAATTRHACSAMEWMNYSWDEPEGARSLDVCLGEDAAARQSYDLDQLGPLDPITSRSGAQLFACVYADGPTRVLCLTDTPERWQRFAQSASAAHGEAEVPAHVDAARLVLEVKLLGVGLTLVMDKPVAAAAAGAEEEAPKVAREEILHVAVEAISLGVVLDAMEVKVELAVSHFQVDNMLESALFPVLLCPADSGHHSLLRAGAGSFEHVDVVRVVACVDPRFRTIRCVKLLDVAVQQLTFKADMGLIIAVMQCGSSLGPPSVPSAEAAEQALQEMLTRPAAQPALALAGATYIYFDLFRLSGLVIAVTFDMASGADVGVCARLRACGHRGGMGSHAQVRSRARSRPMCCCRRCCSQMLDSDTSHDSHEPHDRHSLAKWRDGPIDRSIC